MSSERQLTALMYTVGLRLSDVTSQQQRAATVAAADGVLIGFVASTSGTDTGTARGLVLVALILLAVGVLAAAVAMFPATIPGLGSTNPALAGTDDQMTDDMCAKLSAVIAGTKLADIQFRRGVAIAVQLGAVAVALGLLVASAFAANPPAGTK